MFCDKIRMNTMHKQLPSFCFLYLSFWWLSTTSKISPFSLTRYASATCIKMFVIFIRFSHTSIHTFQCYQLIVVYFSWCEWVNVFVWNNLTLWTCEIHKRFETGIYWSEMNTISQLIWLKNIWNVIRQTKINFLIDNRFEWLLSE